MKKALTALAIVTTLVGGATTASAGVFEEVTGCTLEVVVRCEKG